MLPLYPDISPEIIAIAIGSGAIGCTIVTDSLFWLAKQYCGATLNETFKYYTTATFIASVVALAGTALESLGSKANSAGKTAKSMRNSAVMAPAIAKTR